MTNKFKNMRIGKRLIIAFFVVALLSGLGAFTGIFYLKGLDSNYSAALVDYGFAQGDIGVLGMDFQGHRATVLYLIFERDADSRQELIRELNTKVEKIEEDMQTVKAGIVSEDTMAVYNDLETRMEDYAAVRAETVRLSETSSDQALEYFRENAAPRASAIQGVIEDMLQSKMTIGDQISVSMSRQSSRSILFMVIIMALSFIVSVFIAIATTKGLTGPMKEIKKSAEDMAEGKLNAKVDYCSKDELGVLSERGRGGRPCRRRR